MLNYSTILNTLFHISGIIIQRQTKRAKYASTQKAVFNFSIMKTKLASAEKRNQGQASKHTTHY